jgi:hypothetical protein
MSFNIQTFQESSYELSQLEVLINEMIIEKGGKVLLVAHSQGNFIANEAVLTTRNSLMIHWDTDQQKVRLVSVATPTASVEGEGSYTTLSSDGVIRPIPTALAANVTNSTPVPGIFDHEFVKHYLNGDASGSQIIHQIDAELERLSKIGKSGDYPSCKAWFDSNSKNLAEGDDCVLSCNAFSSDMATFTCHSICPKLCNCRNSK